MPIPSSRNQNSSSSRPFQASHSIMQGSSSRPFLNMLNPLGRTYQGYIQADQSVLEEEENREGTDDDDLEAGQAQSLVFLDQKTKRRSGKQRRVAWRPGASELNVLHPNIHQEDKIHEGQSSDDEVPQSFMIEASSRKPSKTKSSETVARPNSSNSPRQVKSATGRSTLPTAAPSPLSVPPRPSEVDVDPEDTPRPSESKARNAPHDNRQIKQMGKLDEYERALWNWVNVYNLDAFLQEVYQYYEGKGIYSIALARGLNLLTVGFVIGFSTFLLGCVDYSRIRPEGITRLSDVVVHRCVAKFSGVTLLFFILFTAFYIWQIVSFVMDVIRLVDMYHFYTHLLRIPDEDIQTISWPEIVRRIGSIREDNPLTAISSAKRVTSATATAKLDAHDIANRIMRQENYLIALFNKELLDLRVPLPPVVERFLKIDRGNMPNEGGRGMMLTHALEWNLRFCLMEFLFDAQGRVRKVFLKSKNRAALIEGLERRFIFMGILNFLFAPFIVLYLIMYSFFRYFEEYHKNPSSIGGRRYTRFAQWKFREFNELPHLFVRRLDESYPAASMYIGQFPNEKLTLIMRFVAFIAGSFAAVLVLASVVDPDLFLHFEITPHRTVLFYLGVFGSVLAVARGMIPDDNKVFDPELLMMEVITYTHYMPDNWKGELHSKKVHQEFGEIFAMKIIIFAQELLSVVLTPFVLWLSLPACAPAIIDFFRDFSVHVDGRGYVCSFAEFNFQRHGNVRFGAPAQKQDRRMVSNEGKMEKSFLNFKAANPDWNPSDPSGSVYLNRMADYTAAYPRHSPSYGRWRTPGTEGHLAATIIGDRRQEGPSTDRAQTYDRALRQSQYAATTRRRQGGFVGAGTGSGSGSGPMLSSSVHQSEMAGITTAQTVILGDSQGSVELGGVAVSRATDGTPPEGDMAPDGEVGSGLGESYVDGTRTSRTNLHGGEDENEQLEDGGVLRLLAQIYSGKGGLNA